MPPRLARARKRSGRETAIGGNASKLKAFLTKVQKKGNVLGSFYEAISFGDDIQVLSANVSSAGMSRMRRPLPIQLQHRFEEA